MARVALLTTAALGILISANAAHAGGWLQERLKYADPSRYVPVPDLRIPVPQQSESSIPDITPTVRTQTTDELRSDGSVWKKTVYYDRRTGQQVGSPRYTPTDDRGTGSRDADGVYRFRWGYDEVRANSEIQRRSDEQEQQRRLAQHHQQLQQLQQQLHWQQQQQLLMQQQLQRQMAPPVREFRTRVDANGVEFRGLFINGRLVGEEPTGRRLR